MHHSHRIGNAGCTWGLGLEVWGHALIHYAAKHVWSLFQSPLQQKLRHHDHRLLCVRVWFRDSTILSHMQVVVKIVVPFWVPDSTAPIFLEYPKGTRILTTTHRHFTKYALAVLCIDLHT